MTSTLRKYLPAVIVFHTLILLIAINPTSISPYHGDVYAYGEIETICREQVSSDIQRRKDEAGRVKEKRLLAVGAVTPAIIAGGGVIAGPPGVIAGGIVSGAGGMAILVEYDNAIQALEEEEDQRLAQCARDAQYLRDEADAAEQGNEGMQSIGTIAVFGFGFGTSNQRGITGGEFL